MVFPSAASRSGATHSSVAPRPGLPGPRRSHPRRRSPCPTTVMVGTPGSSTPPALFATLDPAAPRRETRVIAGEITQLYARRTLLFHQASRNPHDGPRGHTHSPPSEPVFTTSDPGGICAVPEGSTPAGNRPCLRSCQDSGKHVSDLTAGVIRVGGVRDHIIGHLPLRV